jgi:ATP-dependent Zn protease
MRNKKDKERKERARQYQVARLVAFHEAGHVAFAMLNGIGIEIVTIDPQRVKELTGQQYPGYTRYNESGLAEADLILCLTAHGLTSEAMFVSGGVVSTEEDDLRCITEMLENQLGLRGPAKQRELDRIRLLTQQFMSNNRSTVKAIAKALMERRSMSGEDVQNVLAAL